LSTSSVQRLGLLRLVRVRRAATEIAMVGPAVALVATFIVLPIFIAVFLSFTDWDGFTIPPDGVGWRNYSRLADDPAVRSAAKLTVIIAVVGTVVCNVLGLGFAMLVNGTSTFNAFMRAVVFYPYVVGPIIIGFLWSSILGTNGAINSVLESGGHSGLPFLSDPSWAVVSVIGVHVWSLFGVNVVLYLAGLQTIPAGLIEAARIDGANAWQTFWHVKLPLLAPTVTLNVILVIVGLLRAYELILALTNGGPAGTTQTTVFHVLATSFKSSRLGYGAAESVVLLNVIIFVTLIITSTARRRVQAVAE
jgi:raffinose/stachyose/melibiose transport system permease protein